MTPQDRTLQAQIADRTFDIAFRDGQLFVDEEPVDYSFEQLSEVYLSLLLDGASLPVMVETIKEGHYSITLSGRQVAVQIKDERDLLLERFGGAGRAGADVEVRAPMPGLVLSVLVEPGQSVEAHEGLVVLEAMKMENELRAHAAGVVKAVHVAAGDAVGKNDLLVEFEV